MRYRIGIFDSEEGYSESLMAYLNNVYSDSFFAVMFRDQQLLRNYLKTDKLDILMIGDSERDIEYFGHIVYLVSDKERINFDSIFKYQSAKNIAERLLEQLNGKSRTADTARFFTCIFSPVGRCGKTELAHGICSLDNRSLYIGFEDHISVERYVQRDISVDGLKELSGSFMYLLATKNPEILNIIKRFPEINGYKEIVSFGGAFELDSITAEELLWLKNLLLQDGFFDRVVVDFGSGVVRDFRIIELFDLIYFLQLENSIAMNKVSYFFKNNAEMLSKLQAHIRYLYVPDCEAYSEEMRSYIEMNAL